MTERDEIEQVKEEAIRRASEGCESDVDGTCTEHELPMDTWCDPCRLQEAAKAIEKLEAVLRRSRAVPPSLRELLVRADSYLSLLWYRHTPPNIKTDSELRYDVERTIGELREASKGEPAETRAVLPEAPEADLTPEQLAELRADFVAWLDKRDVPPAVRKLLTPWVSPDTDTAP